jgi:hypothetical protein
MQIRVANVRLPPSRAAWPQGWTIVMFSSETGLAFVENNESLGAQAFAPASAQEDVVCYYKFYQPLMPGDIDTLIVQFATSIFTEDHVSGTWTITLMTNDYGNPYAVSYPTRPPILGTDQHITETLSYNGDYWDLATWRYWTFDLTKQTKPIIGLALSATISGSDNSRIQFGNRSDGLIMTGYTHIGPHVDDVIAREAYVYGGSNPDFVGDKVFKLFLNGPIDWYQKFWQYQPMGNGSPPAPEFLIQGVGTKLNPDPYDSKLVSAGWGTYQVPYPLALFVDLDVPNNAVVLYNGSTDLIIESKTACSGKLIYQFFSTVTAQ